MGIFRLVAFLEETFNVRVGDEEITHDNLESIDAIERLVWPSRRSRGLPEPNRAGIGKIARIS